MVKRANSSKFLRRFVCVERDPATAANTLVVSEHEPGAAAAAGSQKQRGGKPRKPQPLQHERVECGDIARVILGAPPVMKYGMCGKKALKGTTVGVGCACSSASRCTIHL